MSATRQTAGSRSPHPNGRSSTDDAAQPTLKRSLATTTLVVFGLAYMVPLTIFSTYGIVTETTEGHLPMAYLVTLATMLFTTLTYAMLSRSMPVSGSAYSYTRAAFGGHVGFLSGWALLSDYLLLPLINYLLLGIYVNAQIPSIPAWAVTLAAIALVTALNITGVDVVRNANVVLVVAQLVFAAVFIVLAASRLSPDASPLDPFVTPDMHWSGVFAGASILALSFLGFDAVSTLAEEARDPRRSVPRAILITTLTGGLLFTTLAWFGQMVFPEWQRFESADTAALEVMGRIGGELFQIFFLAAYIAGAVASAIASQASVSRLLYAMGRDGVLPRAIFGRLSPRFRTPVGAILVVAAVGLLALVLPLDAVASIISFGALAAFSMVNLAAVKHFLVDRRLRGPGAIVKYLLVPLIGFALTAWLWTSLSPLALLVGCSWLVIGVGVLALVTRGFRRPPPSVDVDDVVGSLDGADDADEATHVRATDGA